MSEAHTNQAAEKKKGKKQTNGSAATVPTVETPTVNPVGSTLSGAGGTGGSGSGSGSDGGKIKNISIHIDKLVERFEIHSATVGESAENIKAIILQTLMGALNDSQLATS